ncbi:DMT family transporter [uncultured Desulfuromusa sp.]|uniref:DMT family transporter n=1 Tax=uncultured Desulfuromusa sp. TaxID=219183 RepID=UPI002AA6160F|nr:DMT family transporter [uncultured Desulfuromusa sp.]
MSAKSHFSTSRTGILSVSISAVLWGTVGIATQAIYQRSDLTAVAAGFYRLSFAFPVVAILCWKLVDKQQLRIVNQEYLKIILIGMMLALYQVFYFASISYVGVAVATLITLCTAPVLVSLLSAVFLKERLTGYTLGALLAALTGTVLLVGLPEQNSVAGNVAMGVALALGSATGYAIVALMGRSIAATCHPMLSTTVSFGVGAIFLFPFAAGNIFSATYSIEIWELILYIGLMPTAVAYMLFFFGMRSIKASTASILTLLEPLTATVLAWIFFAERLAPSGIIGAFLLLAAIAVLYRGEISSK